MNRHLKYRKLNSQDKTSLSKRVMDKHDGYSVTANLTGAGMGMKGEHTRNFEAGILTTEPALVESAVNQFDEVWMGKFCGKYLFVH